jgi:cytosine/adenosine deaminase-related metal-dependent hydrolase
LERSKRSALGRKADLLVVDTLRAHLVPAGRFISALVHNGQPNGIESVMIDGPQIRGQVQAAGPVNVPRLRRPQ